jgi:hypothetical protein
VEAAQAPQGHKTEKNAARRRSARQACIALLAALAVFIGLQIAAAVALERWLPSGIDPEYGARVQRIRRGRAADPEQTRTVVMLGSSRAYYGLQAERLDAPLSRQTGRPVSVVNFAFPGAGPLSELLTWRRLRRHGVRPQLLLIEVFPAFLSRTFPVDDTREERLPIDRLFWRDLATLDRYGTCQARPGLRRDFMEATAVAVYSHRLTLLNAVAPRLIGSEKNRTPLIERLAAGPLATNPTRQERDKMLDFARAGYRPVFRDFPIGGRNCDALRELLASCRQAGVPAALVLMPEGPAFRSWCPPETWRQIQEWVEQTGREAGAAVVNAREWMDEDDFLDSYHLLPNGADKFTDRLGREAIVPLLR